MSALAGRYGSKALRASVRLEGVRPLEQVALENAVEGCVRETYGALVATWQAQTARDPAIRTAMHAIARDETRHAALAWRVARWADSRLSLPARRRITESRRAAVEELERENAVATPPELVTLAGMPDASRARVLFAALADALLTR